MKTFTYLLHIQVDGQKTMKPSLSFSCSIVSFLPLSSYTTLLLRHFYSTNKKAKPLSYAMILWLPFAGPTAYDVRFGGLTSHSFMMPGVSYSQWASFSSLWVNCTGSQDRGLIAFPSKSPSAPPQLSSSGSNSTMPARSRFCVSCRKVLPTWPDTTFQMERDGAERQSCN